MFNLITWLVFCLCLPGTVKSEICESSMDDTGSLLQAYSVTEVEHQSSLVNLPSQVVVSEHKGSVSDFLQTFFEPKHLFGGSDVFLLTESNVEGQSASSAKGGWKKLKPNQRYGIFLMIILMGLAFCLNFIQGSKHTMLILVVLWGTASVTMNVVNKIAVIAIPLPMTLIVVQMLTAVLLLSVGWGPRRMWNEIRQNGEYSLRWGLLSFFFSSGLVTSILAIQAGGVVLMVVVRNLMPLLTLVIERLWMPDSTRAITLEAVSALIFLVLGTGLYAVLDVGASGSWNALGYIVLNMIAMITYRLVERRLLLSLPQEMSFGTLALMQNACGLLPVIGLLFLWGEHNTSAETLLQCRQDPMALTVIFFSGVTGLALGYYSIMLQKEITATGFLTLQASTTVMTIILAVIVLGERLGLLSVVGCIVSLWGGTWYGFIVNRPQPPLEEPQAVKEESQLVK